MEKKNPHRYPHFRVVVRTLTGAARRTPPTLAAGATATTLLAMQNIFSVSCKATSLDDGIEWRVVAGPVRFLCSFALETEEGAERRGRRG